jgi:hypothetical protein
MTERSELHAHAREWIQLDDDHQALIAKVGTYDDHRQSLTTTLAAIAPLAVRGAIDAAVAECVLFPMPNGEWEAFAEMEGPLWTDGRATFNRRLPFCRACPFFGGIEDTDKDEYVFGDASQAMAAARSMGADITLPELAIGREIRFGRSRDGRLVIRFKRVRDDGPLLEGWINNKFTWVRTGFRRILRDDPQPFEYDNVFRNLLTLDDENAGWRFYTQDWAWVGAPRYDIRAGLRSYGVPAAEVESVMGTAFARPWKLVNIPFGPEYPGNRQWNLRAAQFAVEPAEGEHPHWDMIMSHCGRDLDAYVTDLDWCQEWGLKTGADYLKLWLAIMFRQPFTRLPYLFMFGPEDSGKSIFHEAVRLLMTRGVEIADSALTNQNDFNGELANAVLCVVEEKDISKAPGAMNKIKEWITAANISVHKKGCEPYSLPNVTHWVQCANRIQNCPVAIGDTRITMIHVTRPETVIPKPTLLEALEAEAAAFLYTLLHINIPAPRNRLGLPIISTSHKLNAAEANAGHDPVGQFMRERVVYERGKTLPANDVFEAFKAQLPAEERGEWSITKFGTALNRLGYARALKTDARVRHILDTAWAAV